MKGVLPLTKLYHASSVPGIDTLKTVSLLHGSDGERVVYLTESLPYSLFYIWDAAHNKKPGKHVTCWLKDGIVHYEEQFPGQLRAFYEGVKGYVYSAESRESFEKMPNRESMWFSRSDVPVSETVVIEDVYAEIMKYVQLGQVKVIPFDEVPQEKLRLLYDHMAQDIIDKGWLQQSDCPEAVFYQTFFPAVWGQAFAVDSLVN